MKFNSAKTIELNGYNARTASQWGSHANAMLFAGQHGSATIVHPNGSAVRLFMDRGRIRKRRFKNVRITTT